LHFTGLAVEGESGAIWLPDGVGSAGVFHLLKIAFVTSLADASPRFAVRVPPKTGVNELPLLTALLLSTRSEVRSESIEHLVSVNARNLERMTDVGNPSSFGIWASGRFVGHNDTLGVN